MFLPVPNNCDDVIRVMSAWAWRLKDVVKEEGMIKHLWGM